MEPMTVKICLMNKVSFEINLVDITLKRGSIVFIMTCHRKLGNNVMISWGMLHLVKISTLARSEKYREYSPAYHDMSQ